MSARIVCLCASILAFSAGSVDATLIDSFGDVNQSAIVWSSLPFSASQANPGSSVAIGGYRDLALQWVSGDLAFANVLPAGPTGEFSFTQGTAQGTTAITWDGADTPGTLSYLLGTDLTSGGGNEFLLDVSATTGTGVGLTMTVYSDATHASQYSTSVVGGFSGSLLLPYGGFSTLGPNPADFSNVGAIVLQLNGVGHTGSDITFSSVQTATAPVPEPSALALAAIGVAIIGLGRRWRKS